MVELVTFLAVALLIAGVIGSVVPLVPGPILSLAGVYSYWWSTGFIRPGLGILLAFTFFGLSAVAVDYLSGAIAAKAGGASTTTGVAAAAVGIALFFVFGPLGVLAGVALTVFTAEVYRGGDPRASARAAIFSAVGVLGSAAVQVVFTGTMLLGFLAVLVLG